MNNKDILQAVERIRNMENIFDSLQAEFESAPEIIKQNSFAEKMARLEDYYHGGLWLADYTMDEDGILPADLKRGVLSQDGVFNFLDKVKNASRQITVDLSAFPQELHPFLQGAYVYDSTCGENSQVLYSSRGYYIKIAPATALKREAEITAFLHKNGMGAQVVYYLSEDKDYMVTLPVKGQDATHFLSQPEKLCRALAEAMKHLHSLPVTGVPLSPQMDFYNTNNSLAADTFIHGDFCLPNIMMTDYTVTDYIDLGLAGVGDRHIDIFWCLWSLWFNLKTDRYTDLFIDMYGRDKVDIAKLKDIAAKEGKI